MAYKFKKSFTLGSLLTIAIFFVACGQQTQMPEISVETPAVQPTEATIEEVVQQEFITVVDARGDTIENVPVNPRVIAVYDQGVLDTLYRAGIADSDVELILVPGKDTLPDLLGWYRDQPNSRVINAGTLHFVDLDVFALAQPDLVITGARSFGHNADGQTIEEEERAALIENTFSQHPTTAFVHLGHNITDVDQVRDVQIVAEVLAQIFPDKAEYLLNTFATFDEQIQEVYRTVSESGKNAILVMLMSPFDFNVDLGSGRNAMIFDLFGYNRIDESIEAAAVGDADSELVLRLNPDVIFVLPHPGREGTDLGFNNFLNDPIIQTTDAYVSGNIFQLSGREWHSITNGFTAMEIMIYEMALPFTN